MQAILEKSGINLFPEQLEMLWRYHNLIREHNEDRELTRIIEFEAMVVKHYVDCMIVGQFVHLPSPLVDIGSGAGFPGIPLKIRYPKLKIILAEPRPKRIVFLNLVIKKLGLKDIKVFEHKVVSRSFQEPVGGVVTRALETLDKTLLRSSAALDTGGKLIFLKGPGVEPEIADVKKRFGDKYRLVMNHAYSLPHSSHERRLVVYEKLIPREIPASGADTPQ